MCPDALKRKAFQRSAGSGQQRSSIWRDKGSWRRHNIPNPRQSERCLRFPSTRVVARVAVDGLVLPELCPVEVGGKIRTAFHPSQWIDVNRAHAGAAWLGNLTAHVTWDLLEVVIGVGDHAPRLLLECEQLSHHLLQLLCLPSLDQTTGISVFGVGV